MTTQFLTATDWRRTAFQNKYFLKCFPVTKLLILSVTSFTFFINIFQLESKVVMPLYGLSPLIVPNLQVWRLLSHQLYLTSNTELLLSVIILYYLRLLELRLGTVKFLTKIVVTSTLSIIFQIGIQVLLPMKNTIGPSELLTSLMIYYYKYVPHYQNIRIFRFNLTNKVYLYILFLQFVLINMMSNVLSIACGVISTLLVSSPNLPFKRMKIPNSIIQFISRHIIDLDPFTPPPLPSIPSRAPHSSSSPSSLAYCLVTPPHIPDDNDDNLYHDDHWNNPPMWMNQPHLFPHFPPPPFLPNNFNNNVNNNNSNNNNNNNSNNNNNLFFNQQDLFASLQQLYQRNHLNNFNNFNINNNDNNNNNNHNFDDEIQVELSNNNYDSNNNDHGDIQREEGGGGEDETAEEVRNNPYLIKENISTLQSLFGLSKEECLMILHQTNNDINLAISILLAD